MPGPMLDPFDADSDLPARVDVVVIGGGIIGASTALELAERGQSVLLCEKGVIGGEQSSRNWGWVRLAMRDPREIPLMIEAQKIWEGLDARTGRRTGYRRAGILYAATDAKSYDRRERWSRHLAAHGVPGGMVSGAALDALLPGRKVALKGGLHTPLDGMAEPQWAAPAIAAAARDRGATVLTGCAVRSLDLVAGRVAGVVTERGRVACDAVVLAGGAWSRLFAGNAGIALPQLKILNTVMRTTPVEGGPDVTLWANSFALRKRADGGYTVASGVASTYDLVPDSFRLARAFFPALIHEWSSMDLRLTRRWLEEARQARRWGPEDVTPFELDRILDPAPSARVLRSCWAEAQQAFPVLGTAQVAQGWGGMIDVTPDAIPVISGVDRLPGMFIATGFSGHGFGIGPGAGRLMADLVLGATPVVDPVEFRLSRFTDGSRVHIDPGY
ncbi:NAD(P)/FAD-dependent oxidoreductase [Pseudodonghicola sp.]|uniref:NAD(P)/FAD-dependent oxidoreductase n=1 Tax=Pseudodonghicola sp. TaxID=1969463 RepID=UPI003A976976